MAIRLSVISSQMILDIVQGKDIGGVFSVGSTSIERNSEWNQL